MTDIFGKAQVELRAMVDTKIKEELKRLKKANALDFGKVS